MFRGFLITGVKNNSPAYKLGIRPGDRLLKINDSSFFDILGYQYLLSERRVKVTVLKKDGKTIKLGWEKRYDEDLGLKFAYPTLGPLRRCQNRCIFCFIDQQPPGLRPSLYEKDDDYRLSFFFGNYITLTNAGKLELKRIVNRRLSPLYISIHATEPSVRIRMMRNPAAGKIMSQLKYLAESGIEMHGQVVICPGVNDGEVLKKTVRELSLLYPRLKTVALVPVGLTRYRQGLFPLRRVTPDEALKIVEEYSFIQEEFQKRLGTPFIYLADEFYLLSGFPLPSHEHYGDYHQLENGVGLGRLFLNELNEWKRKGLPVIPGRMEISIVTGRAAEPFLKKFVAELTQVQGLKVNLYPLPSIFWGENITVTGLLTGQDLLRGLTGKRLGNALLITRTMLREGTDLFLDGCSTGLLSSYLGTRVYAVSSLEEIRTLLLSGLKETKEQKVGYPCPHL